LSVDLQAPLGEREENFAFIEFHVGAGFLDFVEFLLGAGFVAGVNAFAFQRVLKIADAGDELYGGIRASSR
jgi:hypothetical protein